MQPPNSGVPSVWEENHEEAAGKQRSPRGQPGVCPKQTETCLGKKMQENLLMTDPEFHGHSGKLW